MSELQSYLDQALKKVKINNMNPVVESEDYDIYAEIAEMLISIRNEMNITQGDLARMTGVSQANISKFENGNSRPSLTTLKKIADGLGKRLVVTFGDREVED